MDALAPKRQIHFGQPLKRPMDLGDSLWSCSRRFISWRYIIFPEKPVNNPIPNDNELLNIDQSYDEEADESNDDVVFEKLEFQCGKTFIPKPCLILHTKEHARKFKKIWNVIYVATSWFDPQWIIKIGWLLVFHMIHGRFCHHGQLLWASYQSSNATFVPNLFKIKLLFTKKARLRAAKISWLMKEKPSNAILVANLSQISLTLKDMYWLILEENPSNVIFVADLSQDVAIQRLLKKFKKAWEHSHKRKAFCFNHIWSLQRPSLDASLVRKGFYWKIA